MKQYRSGHIKLFDLFIGKIMSETRGNANPHRVNKILREKLSAL
ncbi:MAG: hypothetical protein MUC94_03735 [bacterium]|nr:hypothetical protein [bacterium]